MSTYVVFTLICSSWLRGNKWAYETKNQSMIWRWKKIKKLDSSVIAYTNLKKKKLPEFPKPIYNCKIASNSHSSLSPVYSGAQAAQDDLETPGPRGQRSLLSRHAAPDHGGEASASSGQKSWLSPSFWRDTSLTCRSALDRTEWCKLKAPSHLFMQLNSCSADVPEQMCKCPKTIKLWFIVQDAC